jgi:hypothetical protein
MLVVALDKEEVESGQTCWVGIVLVVQEYRASSGATSMK